MGIDIFNLIAEKSKDEDPTIRKIIDAKIKGAIMPSKTLPSYFLSFFSYK